MRFLRHDGAMCGIAGKSVGVVGGGPAGLAAGLALGLAGLNVTLLAPPHRIGSGPDRRTAALFAGSIELLVNLGAWDAIRPESEPIKAIRIIDDTGGILRAPEVTFTAEEVGLDVFGWNVPNAALIRGLTSAARREGSRLRLVETAGVEKVEPGDKTVRLMTAERTELEVDLLAAADGRNSLSRTAAGIATTSWAYPQAAVATSFSHSRPHHNISTEFHRPAGPFTTVPLPGLVSSLVWVETPEEANRLALLDEASFRSALEARLMGLLGEVGEIGPRALFPLSGLTAKVMGARRIALIGEAGHVIPPIGAQGLNLGLRDAAGLADCVAAAQAAGQDVGSDTVLSAYSKARRIDITSRIYTVDVLNRTLISRLVPVNLARGLGLYALKALSPLRRVLIREGLQPASALPLLMQPDGARLLALAARGDRASSNAAA